MLERRITQVQSAWRLLLIATCHKSRKQTRVTHGLRVWDTEGVAQRALGLRNWGRDWVLKCFGDEVLVGRNVGERKGFFWTKHHPQHPIYHPGDLPLV